MFLKPFYTQQGSCFSFSQQQASAFAKHIANDYNKIHDVDNQHFCVPGDLLFAVSLATFGLSEQISIDFTGKVKNDVDLQFTPFADNKCAIVNTAEQALMQLEMQGDNAHDEEIVTKLIKEYVHFSGKNFPNVMVPLMQEHQLMFNPSKALIMYRRMQINMTRVNLNNICLCYDDAVIEVRGKRATIIFKFNFYDGDELVGTGHKEMLVSGLLPYEESAMDDVIAAYHAIKANYTDSI